MPWNGIVTLPKDAFKNIKAGHASELLFVPLSEDKSPDYAVVVPETHRTYRQDDGRLLGSVEKVFPAVAAQMATAEALYKETLSEPSDSINEGDNLGYVYTWPTKHAPGPKNTKWELTEGQSRDPAIIGSPDSGKFCVFFANTVTYEHRPEVYRNIQGFNWHSQKDITRLNKWRSQVFGRRLGGKRFNKTPNEAWTADEQEQLGQIVKRVLKLTKGDWDKIDFEAVGDYFNAMMTTTTQPKGTELADEECDRPEVGFAQRRHLIKDRKGLVRGVEDVEGRARATKASIEAAILSADLFQEVDFTCLMRGDDKKNTETMDSHLRKTAYDSDDNMTIV